MKNWSTDTKKLEENKDKFAIWSLEQTINFGLTGEKINLSQLKKYWSRLLIDPGKKKFLSLFLN